MLRPFERAVDARRGDFQRVCSLDNLPDIEHIAEFPAYSAKVVHVWATLLVEVQSQHAAATAALMSQFDIDDLHSLHFRQRRGQLPYAGDCWIHLSATPTHKPRASHTTTPNSYSVQH